MWAIILEMAKESWPGLFMWTWPSTARLSEMAKSTLFFFLRLLLGFRLLSNTLAK